MGRHILLVQTALVGFDGGVDPRFQPIELGLGEVVGLVVLGFEKTPVECFEFLAEKPLTAAELVEVAQHLSEGFGVVLAKLVDRPVLGLGFFRQPNDLEVAPCFGFQFPRGSYLVEISVDQQLEQCLGLEANRRPHRAFGLEIEAKRPQIQVLDVHIQHPHWILLADVILHALR